MTDWDCLARPTETTPGKAKHVRDYTMKVGDAYLYDTGRAALAAPRGVHAATAHRGYEHGAREALPV